MTTAAEDRMFGALSTDEAQVLGTAVTKCAAADDALVQEIGVVYLRGMCDLLRAQGKLAPEDVEALLRRAKGG